MWICTEYYIVDLRHLDKTYKHRVASPCPTFTSPAERHDGDTCHAVSLFTLRSSNDSTRRGLGTRRALSLFALRSSNGRVWHWWQSCMHMVWVVGDNGCKPSWWPTCVKVIWSIFIKGDRMCWCVAHQFINLLRWSTPLITKSTVL